MHPLPLCHCAGESLSRRSIEPQSPIIPMERPPTVMSNHDKSHMVEQVMNHALEIIYLLTGEEYMVVRKPGRNVPYSRSPGASQGYSRTKRPILRIPSPSRRPPRNVLKPGKPEDLSTEPLPTAMDNAQAGTPSRERGYIPVTCGDMALYFSMEEWKYVEQHKDQYVNLMVEDHPTSSGRANGPFLPASMVSDVEEEENPVVTGLRDVKEKEVSEDTGVGAPDAPRVFVPAFEVAEKPFLSDQNPNRIPEDKYIGAVDPSPGARPDTEEMETPFVIGRKGLVETYNPQVTDLGGSGSPSIVPNIESADCPVVSGHNGMEEKAMSANTFVGDLDGAPGIASYVGKDEKPFVRGQPDVEDNYIPDNALRDNLKKTLHIIPNIKNEEIPLINQKNIKDEDIPEDMGDLEETLHIIPNIKNEEMPLIEQIKDEDIPEDMGVFSAIASNASDTERDEKLLVTVLQDLEEKGVPGGLCSSGSRKTEQECPLPPGCSEAYDLPGYSIGRENPTIVGTGSYDVRKSKVRSRKSFGGKNIGMKVFHCCQCVESFRKKSAYVSHLEAHGEDVSLFTPVLSKYSHLMKQARIQTAMLGRSNCGKKGPSCAECGKVFSCKSQLVSHWKTHTGEKPYACNQCDKRFSWNSSLSAHKRTHTGEKPFACPLCGKRCSDSSNLLKHQKIHAGDSVIYIRGEQPV